MNTIRKYLIRPLISLAFMVLGSYVFGQDNMLDLSVWVAGTGSTYDNQFKREGSTAENIREPGTDPFGNSSILWKAQPLSTSGRHGGWYTIDFPIDPNKSYRFSVWIKKTNSNTGGTFFSFNAYNSSMTQQTLLLDGTVRNNPTFFKTDLPSLDTWYLLVGYVWANSHTGTVSEGGIYDLTGAKLVTLEDYKFASGAVKMRHRTHLASGGLDDTQWHYGPTLYEINGQEPSVPQLLDPITGSVGPGSPGSGDGPWSANDSGIHYNMGNVGIGTGNPGTDWKLAVNGKIRSKEIKVETGWADYVFEDNYPLPTLEEVQKHITEKGHLMNIPSAAEVEANGIELGEMNRLLLEKIEELTLYLIEQDKVRKSLVKKLQKQEKKQLALEKRISKLENY